MNDEMTLLQIAAIVEGSERLADEIGRAGVTTKSVARLAFRDGIVKRQAELRSITEAQDVAFMSLLRRKQIVYARLGALLTIYNANEAEQRRRSR